MKSTRSISTKSRIVALALIICALFLAACSSPDVPVSAPTPAPTPTPEPVLEVTTDDRIRFDDMVYTHLHMEQLATDIDALTRSIPFMQSEAEAIAALEIAEGTLEDVNTVTAIASIRAALDMTDTYYVEESIYCNAYSPNVTNAYINFVHTLNDHGYGDLADDTAIMMDVSNASAYMLLSMQEVALEEEYLGILYLGTVNIGGEDMTYSRIRQLEGDEWSDALNTWKGEYAQRLSDIYVELVKTRLIMSQSLGYDHYIDFALDSMHASYSRDELNRLLERVKNDVAINYEGPSTEVIPMEDAYTAAQGIVNGINPSYGQIWAKMRSLDLIDVSVSATKRDSAFTTYIAKHESPYLFMSLHDNVDSFGTLMHEFGHFVDMWTNGESAAIDLAWGETLAHGMEALARNRYAATLDTKDAVIASTHDDILLSIVSQSFYAAAEEKIYSLPIDEVTTQSIESIVRELSLEYNMAKTDFEADYYSEAFLTVPHFFTMPGYVQCYVPSGMIALEIASMDERAGADAFAAFLIREGTTYRDAIAASGLTDPFM